MEIGPFGDLSRGASSGLIDIGVNRQHPSPFYSPDEDKAAPPPGRTTSSTPFRSVPVPPPLRWCQSLAGIDLIPALPVYASHLHGAQRSQLVEGLSGYRQQQRVATLVQRLQAVKGETRE